MHQQRRHVLPLGLAAGLFLLISRGAAAQGRFEVLTGEEFDRALPRDFYLEGSAIPTEKRNAALVRTPEGHRVLFALLDTSGYSSQVQQKYIGMMIVEGGVKVCGQRLQTGSYGFGLHPPRRESSGVRKGPAEFAVYSQDGAERCKCEVPAGAEAGRPLAVTLSGDSPLATLQLGRFLVRIE